MKHLKEIDKSQAEAYIGIRTREEVLTAELKKVREEKKAAGDLIDASYFGMTRKEFLDNYRIPYQKTDDGYTITRFENRIIVSTILNGERMQGSCYIIGNGNMEYIGNNTRGLPFSMQVPEYADIRERMKELANEYVVADPLTTEISEKCECNDCQYLNGDLCQITFEEAQYGKTHGVCPKGKAS